MYYIDYHTHTRLSPDSSAPLPAMAAAAERAGLSELCITDHYDVQDERGRRRPPYDWAPARAQYQAALPGLGPGLKLRLGLELGGAPVAPEDCARLLDQPMLDFVIGSLHNLSPQAGGSDFYFLDYSTQEACYAALDDYFTSMAALAPQAGLYDVLGHIIYPVRYMGPSITLDRYMERIEDILRTVVHQGRGIEVNTYRGKSIEVWRPILTLYRALGGEIVTVGSDAHAPQDMGAGVAEAYALLRDTGFRFVTVFDKRRPFWTHL